MNICDHLVVGAGPAGLFAALQTAGSGKRSVVLEKTDRPGKKLLLSGSGQCNITRDGPIDSFFSHYGDNHRFLKHALLSFTNDDLMNWFRDRGLDMAARDDGKVFPVSLRSRDVLHVLIDECEKNRVEILYGAKVRSVEISGEYFQVQAGNDSWQARTLLIATGGKSYPSTGSSGDGYGMASMLGHSIVQPRPALVSLEIDAFPFSDLAGISIGASSIVLYRNGKRLRHHRGDVLFTHTGLSGPGILDFSRYILAGDEIAISMTAMENRENFRARFVDDMERKSSARLKTMLTGENIPARLAESIMDLCGIPREARSSDLKKERKNRLMDALTGMRFHVGATAGFDRAMCTTGGVALSEINPRTMESRIVKGLYFAGEVLDIDGDTGGYNIQAAFSTGFVAGRAMAG